MKKSINLAITLSLFLSVLFLINCSESDESEGKVSITLSAADIFTNTSSDQSVTHVTWGCVVIDETTTACIYAYNGEFQTDGNMSADAIAAGPGTTGFTFVVPNTKFSNLEGGDRNWYHYVGQFQNGNALGTPTDINGQFDLYANIGEDVDWIVEFGLGANPTANLQ